MFLFLKTMMCQSIPCHKIGDLRGLDIASCFILLLQIGKWLLANDIRASFHFIKSNKLFIGGLVSDLALGTICVMCLTIIRPMVMDVEYVVLLLGIFFFFKAWLYCSLREQNSQILSIFVSGSDALESNVCLGLAFNQCKWGLLLSLWHVLQLNLSNQVGVDMMMDQLFHQ